MISYIICTVTGTSYQGDRCSEVLERGRSCCAEASAPTQPLHVDKQHVCVMVLKVVWSLELHTFPLDTNTGSASCPFEPTPVFLRPGGLFPLPEGRA